MKKILALFILMTTILMLSSITYAEEVHCKALVGYRYSNTSTTGLTIRSVEKDIIKKNVIPVLAKNNCEMVTDSKYFQKLLDKGYCDFSNVERADLFDTYKGDGFKYLIFIEVEPVRSSGWFSGYESSMYIKIVDMVESKYIFNGRIAEVTKYGGAGTVIDKLGSDIRKILEEKVFKN